MTPAVAVRRRSFASARKALWLGLCSATLLTVGAGPAPRGPHAAESGSAGVQAMPTRQVSKPAGSPVKVAWRARVAVTGAEFHVYRGPDREHLQRVARFAADPGERSYRFRDAGSTSRDTVYEVRFVQGPGSEQVVARAYCARTSNLHGGVPPDLAWQSLAVTAEATIEPPAAEPLYEAALASLQSRPRPEPLDSPPRPLPA